MRKVHRIAHDLNFNFSYPLFDRDAVAFIANSVVIGILGFFGNDFVTFRANPQLIGNLLHALISFLLHNSWIWGKFLQKVSINFILGE
jgi:hypothetical protein